MQQARESRKERMVVVEKVGEGSGGGREAIILAGDSPGRERK